ncbi:MAG TPA: polysaccharide biosynthesis tyrosine autokinase [Bryobacteraceae bacterium]|nr:polysaccharide biosynthesis tyrosine autokinase [Bryobacteraceae bacterium]HUO27896.1 polysaccharide biosynthesis tyrosine autokinase [Bryobacteraceae bacterium]
MMPLLPGGSGDRIPNGDNQSLIYPDPAALADAGRQPYAPLSLAADEPAKSVDILRLLRTYWPLVVALMILGAAAGFGSVVLSTPSYKSLLMLEVQSSYGGLLKSNGDPNNDGTSERDIETEVNILRGGTFLTRGAERMQSEMVPPTPMGRDLFSRLRQRLHPATQDPVQAAKQGLDVAMATFNARPVTGTRLIELTCDSTSPVIVAQFLNSMAAEFVEDSLTSRMETARKTSEWLAEQLDETKSRVQESEQKFQDFLKASGNMFAGQDAPLDDTKLAQLKGELARIQAERIARQTRYELTQKSPPESLGEILDDSVLRGYQQQLESLKRDKAALETIYQPKYEKVKKLDAQIALLQKSYQNEVTSVVQRIKNDYDAALRQEKLLSAAYASQSQVVGAEAGKLAQYNSLKRDVDMQRQMYQTLLTQEYEANRSSSVPVNPIRIVEPAVTPYAPYKPIPILNISLGTMLGLVVAGGFAFLREHLDRSIKEPGISRRMFNAPELGVIPNLAASVNGLEKPGWRISKSARLNGTQEDPATALVAWQNGPAFIAESFRGTLASILRNQSSGKLQKMILVTSPGPAEGKTTVVQNLGIALAETDRRVLLVDADFRRPHLHRKFNLPNDWGLIDLLSEDRPLNDYAPEELGVFTGLPGLSVLPNRVTPQNVSKALYSPRLRTTLETLVKRYDMVLVDAPPILSVADARIIAPLTDALILVLRCGVTDRESAMEAYRKIQEDGLTLLGTVLTDYDLSGDAARRYYYDYGEHTRT